MEIKRDGSQPSSKGPADWFTGAIRIDSPRCPRFSFQSGVQRRGRQQVSGTQGRNRCFSRLNQERDFGAAKYRRVAAPSSRSLDQLEEIISRSLGDNAVNQLAINNGIDFGSISRFRNCRSLKSHCNTAPPIYEMSSIQYAHPDHRR